MSSQFHRSEVWWAPLDTLLRVSPSRNQFWIACISFSPPWRRICCQDHSVPCSCMLEVLFPGLLSAGYCSLLLEASCVSSYFLHILPSRNHESKLCNFQTFLWAASLWLTLLFSSSTCKGSCNYTGSVFMIPDAIHILSQQMSNVNYVCKVLLQYLIAMLLKNQKMEILRGNLKNCA